MPKNKIDRKSYCMQSDGTSAEIAMYGEITAARPVNASTGEPENGNFIIQDEFLQDLETLSECQKILIRMNSLGGDASVSILIHNRLRELAEHGREISCVVDGAAMSGGSVIMCACDNVSVYPSSLIMIHRCWSDIDGCYNADELESMAKNNRAWDSALAEIYRRKTGLDNSEIVRMMSEETYMTGEEAVKKGFANSLLSGESPVKIAASADRKTLYIGGLKIKSARNAPVPETIPITVEKNKGDVFMDGNLTNANAEKSAKPQAKQPSNTADRIIQAIRATIDTIPATDSTDALEIAVRRAVEAEMEREAHLASNAEGMPFDARETLEKQAAATERKRLEEIDAIASLYDEETVKNAKYVNPCTAQVMTYRAALKLAKTGAKFIENLQIDAQNSGVQGVPAAVSPDFIKPEASEDSKSPEGRMKSARRVVKLIKSKGDKND